MRPLGNEPAPHNPPRGFFEGKLGRETARVISHNMQSHQNNSPKQLEGKSSTQHSTARGGIVLGRARARRGHSVDQPALWHMVFLWDSQHSVLHVTHALGGWSWRMVDGWQRSKGPVASGSQVGCVRTITQLAAPGMCFSLLTKFVVSKK